MSEQLPGLDFGHAVLNFGAKRHADLETALNKEVTGQRTENRSRKAAVSKLLKPSRSPLSLAIKYAELVRVQRHLGIQNVDENHIDELVDHLEAYLPAISYEQELHTSSLPLKTDPIEKGYVLSIASSLEVPQERVLAKAAIADFYDQDALPENIWLPDDMATRVWLARSYDPSSSRLLARLKWVLNHDKTLLPEYIDLGPLKPCANPPRDQLQSVI